MLIWVEDEKTPRTDGPVRQKHRKRGRGGVIALHSESKPSFIFSDTDLILK